MYLGYTKLNQPGAPPGAGRWGSGPAHQRILQFKDRTISRNDGYAPSGPRSLTSAPTVLPSARLQVQSLWKPATLLAYCVVVAIVAVHHEPWVDEAQAWLLARDGSLPELCMRYLRYEGSPGLWQMLLMVPAKLGFPYWSMHVFAAVCSTAAVAMILWLSPFPPAIRIVLPFTYFLLYQYAVVARSYALLAPLLCAIAWFVPRARSRPWILVGLLILLANVSIHGTLAAAGILLAYLIEAATDHETPGQRFSRQFVLACVVFLLATVVVVYEVWPPTDRDLGRSYAKIYRPLKAFDRADTQLTEAFFSRFRLTYVALALSVFWMARKRVVLYFVLPAVPVLMFSSFVYASPWHGGILFLVWIFAMWTAAARNSVSPTPRYVWLAWVMVLGLHVYWSARASYWDIVAPYSGSEAVAANIAHEVEAGKRIAGQGFMVVAVEPYFRRNIFFNYHGGRLPAFWVQPPAHDVDVPIGSVLGQNPDLIVASLFLVNPNDEVALIHALTGAGYSNIQKFPGDVIWKSSLLVGNSYLVARKRVGP